MKPIELASVVREILPKPIEGVVIERRFNEAHSQMEYHVDCGNDTSKWFLEEHINVVEVPA